MYYWVSTTDGASVLASIFFSWWILDLSYLGVYRLWLLPQYSLLPMLEQYSPSITCTIPFRLLAWQVLAIFMLSVTWGKF